MKNKIYLFILLFLSSFFLKRGLAYDNGDFQVWHTESQEFKVKDSYKIAFNEELRLGDDASELYYHHYEAGFFLLKENLELGLGYRQAYEKKGKSFRAENQPHLIATFKKELGKFKLEDRNRLEYRNFQDKDAIWRYRNKLTVKFPWKFTRFEFQPYLADEVFIEADSKGFSRNRFYCGFQLIFTKKIKGEIYYLLQTSESSGKWINANVLGTKLKLSF